ncbi:conserved hypothetical protein [Thermincola potens JR]|uniref:Uncharacterized protein n=2 Tax=Thermincola TaxID=278993 RepID=D5XB90_THEPJ|nr:conserved hypothetical protein [Thermincola potens JR]
MKIKFEGKIKIKKQVSAKTLLCLLKYLIDEEGFEVKEYKSDEVKLVKTEILNEKSKAGPALSAKEPEAEIKTEIKTEIEIEASDTAFEIEVESSNWEKIKDLTSRIAVNLKSFEK